MYLLTPFSLGRNPTALARRAAVADGAAPASDSTEGLYDLDIAVQDKGLDRTAVLRLAEKGFVISDAISLRGRAIDGITYKQATSQYLLR